MKVPQKVSESVRKLNPHLYPVCGLEGGKPKPTAPQTLGNRPQQRPRRKAGVVVRITLVALRRRMLDDDNNVASFKPLRDAIAHTLGIDDGDSRLRWQYGQQFTTGTEGVIVQVETISGSLGSQARQSAAAIQPEGPR